MVFFWVLCVLSPLLVWGRIDITITYIPVIIPREGQFPIECYYTTEQPSLLFFELVNEDDRSITYGSETINVPNVGTGFISNNFTVLNDPPYGDRYQMYAWLVDVKLVQNNNMETTDLFNLKYKMVTKQLIVGTTLFYPPPTSTTVSVTTPSETLLPGVSNTSSMGIIGFGGFLGGVALSMFCLCAKRPDFLRGKRVGAKDGKSFGKNLHKSHNEICLQCNGVISSETHLTHPSYSGGYGDRDRENSVTELGAASQIVPLTANQNFKGWSAESEPVLPPLLMFEDEEEPVALPRSNSCPDIFAMAEDDLDFDSMDPTGSFYSSSLSGGSGGGGIGSLGLQNTLSGVNSMSMGSMSVMGGASGVGAAADGNDFFASSASLTSPAVSAGVAGSVVFNADMSDSAPMDVHSHVINIPSQAPSASTAPSFSSMPMPTISATPPASTEETLWIPVKVNNNNKQTFLDVLNQSPLTSAGGPTPIATTTAAAPLTNTAVVGAPVIDYQQLLLQLLSQQQHLPTTQHFQITHEILQQRLLELQQQLTINLSQHQQQQHQQQQQFINKNANHMNMNHSQGHFHSQNSNNARHHASSSSPPSDHSDFHHSSGTGSGSSSPDHDHGLSDAPSSPMGGSGSDHSRGSSPEHGYDGAYAYANQSSYPHDSFALPPLPQETDVLLATQNLANSSSYKQQPNNGNHSRQWSQSSLNGPAQAHSAISPTTTSTPKHNTRYSRSATHSGPNSSSSNAPQARMKAGTSSSSSATSTSSSSSSSTSAASNTASSAKSPPNTSVSINPNNNSSNNNNSNINRRRKVIKDAKKLRKVFLCQSPGCGDSFTTRFSLRRHMKRHTGEKPFQCDSCHKRFAEKSTLQRHTQIHTGEKPFKCTYGDCPKAFADLANLKHHQRTTHKMAI